MPVQFGRKATRDQQSHLGSKAPRHVSQRFGIKGNRKMSTTVLGANGAGRPPHTVNPGRQIQNPETNY